MQGHVCDSFDIFNLPQCHVRKQQTYQKNPALHQWQRCPASMLSESVCVSSERLYTHTVPSAAGVSTGGTSGFQQERKAHGPYRTHILSTSHRMSGLKISNIKKMFGWGYCWIYCCWWDSELLSFPEGSFESLSVKIKDKQFSLVSVRSRNLLPTCLHIHSRAPQEQGWYWMGGFMFFYFFWPKILCNRMRECACSSQEAAIWLLKDSDLIPVLQPLPASWP